MSDTGIVKIHGKEYQTVALRVKNFREIHNDWSLVTEIVQRMDAVVVMKASILNEQGRLMATGHSEEYRDASVINKTSALENAETSAIGRALAALGFGGTEFASADEVAHAITGKQAHKPSDGAMESLETDMRTLVRDTAQDVTKMMNENDTAGALDWLEAANFGADAKVACWSLLSSAHRSAIKRLQEERKNGLPAKA